MDWGALELVFTKEQKALENQFLEPIIRSAISVFNKVNISLVIWLSLQNLLMVKQDPPHPKPTCKAVNYMHMRYYWLMA